MRLKTKRVAGIVAALVATTLVVAWPAAAPADAPPPYGGLLVFPTIHGPADLEEYSWTVRVDPGEELVQIDEKTAAVKWPDDTIAMIIEAQPAHDAEGVTVPTTIAVSAGDTLTEIVHHRAGDPAAGGAPFTYPVSAGLGWDGGFHTPFGEIVENPLGAQPQNKCLVPNLKGQNLNRSRRALEAAHCYLGKVHHRRTAGASSAIIRQGAQPGTELPSGSRVWVMVDSAAARTSAAAEPGQAPLATLAEVNIGRAGWKVLVSKGQETVPGEAMPCFTVAYAPIRANGYFLTSTSGPCHLPAWSNPIGLYNKSVFAFAFPSNVVRLRLDLGELGKRNLRLRMLTPEQALEAQVEPFRWGYLKLSGKPCLQEVRGFNQRGHVVYRARDERAAPCNPFPVKGDRPVA